MKDRIVEVSLDRFLQYGIRNMTIAKLVEPMGISTKTVYKYFKSKEELLRECLRVLYKQYYNEFSFVLQSTGNPAATLFSVFKASFSKDFGVNRDFFHDLNYYYPELQNEAISSRENEFDAILLGVVDQGIKGGYFIPDLHPGIVLTGIGTLYTSITRTTSYQHFDVYPAVLFHNLLEVYLRGMCTPKGVMELEKMNQSMSTINK